MSELEKKAVATASNNVLSPKASETEPRRDVLPDDPVGVELAREEGRLRRRDQKHFSRVMDRMG